MCIQTGDRCWETATPALCIDQWFLWCDYDTCIALRPVVIAVWLWHMHCLQISDSCGVTVCIAHRPVILLVWLWHKHCSQATDSCGVTVTYHNNQKSVNNAYCETSQESVVCKQRLLWHIPWSEVGDVWCPTPGLESRGCHLIPLSNFTLLFFCLVLLLFLSCDFSANGPFSRIFSQKMLKHFSLRVRLFVCMALV